MRRRSGTGAALARRARSLVGPALGLAAILLLCVTLVPALLGYERYVITGDSMAGAAPRGSLLYAERVPVSELAAGDVITYEPPAKAGVEGLVTHRIVSIGERGGERLFRTAGDANGSPDPWRFTLPESTQARASFSVPYLGYAFAALGVREVRMLLLGLPALLVGLALAMRLWRESSEEMARARTGPGSIEQEPQAEPG
jgi:signal peptidase